MVLITDTTTTWSSPIKSTENEVWKIRKGGVSVTTVAGPASDDGLSLREGISIRFSAGCDLRYRRGGATDAVIVCEAV